MLFEETSDIKRIPHTHKYNNGNKLVATANKKIKIITQPHFPSKAQLNDGDIWVDTLTWDLQRNDVDWSLDARAVLLECEELVRCVYKWMTVVDRKILNLHTNTVILIGGEKRKGKQNQHRTIGWEEC